METLEDFEAVAPTVLLTSAKLRWQAEILGLLFRADANVDHRADHLWQLSANIGRRQDAWSRHRSLVDGNVRQRDRDQNVRERFGVTRDSENLFIRHHGRVVAEQFPAAL